MQVLVFLGQPSESGTSANRMTLAPAEISVSAEVIRGFFFLPWRSFRVGGRGMENFGPQLLLEKESAEDGGGWGR